MNHEGGCACGEVRYRLDDTPLFVHACHCTWCQRETGSAFVLNGIIEADRVTALSGEPVAVDTPSASGDGQIFFRCPACQVALWSVYSGAGPTFLFVRMGTLDNPAAFPPDIHIFISTKQPWVQIPKGVPTMKNYYRRSEQWPAESLERRKAAIKRASRAP